MTSTDIASLKSTVEKNITVKSAQSLEVVKTSKCATKDTQHIAEGSKLTTFVSLELHVPIFILNCPVR